MDSGLGKSVNMLYADRTQSMKVHDAARTTGRYTAEIVNVRKSGEPFVSFLSASILRNSRGEFLGVMGVSREITEQKLSESALQKRVKELAALNELFHQHLNQRFTVVETFRILIDKLKRDPQDLDNILGWARAQELLELGEIPDISASGDTISLMPDD